MIDFALVVGVGRYDQSAAWNLPGPCANACAIAELLLALGTRPEHIFLFVDQPPPAGPVDPFEARLRGLAAQGVLLTTSAAWPAIDTFFFDTLRQNRPPKSRLFIFWSGHGFTGGDGSRVFICRDYTSSSLTNRVLNASTFLRHLLLPEFNGFSDQLFVADVCGVYSKLAYNNPRVAPATGVVRRNQLALFATPEGEYARDDQGQGVFTRIVLDVLATQKSWPAASDFIQEFNRRVTDALADAGLKPFRMWTSDGEQANERLVGASSTVADSAVFQSVAALLSPIDLPDSEFRAHYLQVVSALGEPQLYEAQGLTGMIRELASMHDGTGGAIPYGLLQFLARLERVAAEGLGATVAAWLQQHAADQKNRLATIRQQLDVESQTKILVVDVENDAAGNVSAFETFVRLRDFSPAPVDPRPRQEVSDWTAFEIALARAIDELRDDPVTRDLEVHVLADPPLFDRAFHRIPLASGSLLGQECVVVLRCRERVRRAGAVTREAWRQRAAALRAIDPKQLELVRIDSAIGPDELQQTAQGLWCMGFLLRPSTAGVTPDVMLQKRLLLKLVRLGAPYLFWLHDGSIDQADWTAIQGAFRRWLGAVRTLDQFPREFTQGRILDDVAAAGTLLWDDPELLPFRTRRE